MLLAEDVLLLLTHDSSGKAAADSSTLDILMGGAVLAELALLGRVAVTGPDGPVVPGVRSGRVVVVDTAPTGDAVLDEGLRRLTVGGRKPTEALKVLAKDLRPELYRRLTEKGHVRPEDTKVLGLFPVRRWPATDTSHEHRVRAGLHEVLVVGRHPAPREASLAGLLAAADKVAVVLPGTGLSGRELKRRAKAVSEAGLGADAVRAAVKAAQDATTAAMVAVFAASGGAAAAGS